MFTADAFIDTVQTGKKTWVNTFVTNETMKEAMIKFIENQSDYTKKAFKATTDAATTVTSETVKAVQEATKFDYVKFGEGIMKAYTAQTSKK
jgi:SHS2 domain-containing protein